MAERLLLVELQDGEELANVQVWTPCKGGQILEGRSCKVIDLPTEEEILNDDEQAGIDHILIDEEGDLYVKYDDIINKLLNQ